jgi:hypothetical protein
MSNIFPCLFVLETAPTSESTLPAPEWPLASRSWSPPLSPLSLAEVYGRKPLTDGLVPMVMEARRAVFLRPPCSGFRGTARDPGVYGPDEVIFFLLDGYRFRVDRVTHPYLNHDAEISPFGRGHADGTDVFDGAILIEFRACFNEHEWAQEKFTTVAAAALNTNFAMPLTGLAMEKYNLRMSFFFFLIGTEMDHGRRRSRGERQGKGGCSNFGPKMVPSLWYNKKNEF